MFKVYNKDTGTQNDANGVVLLSLLLILNIFHTFSIVNFEHVIASWVVDRIATSLNPFHTSDVLFSQWSAVIVGFLMFLGGLERDYWHEMGLKGMLLNLV